MNYKYNITLAVIVAILTILFMNYFIVSYEEVNSPNPNLAETTTEFSPATINSGRFVITIIIGFFIGFVFYIFSKNISPIFLIIILLLIGISSLPNFVKATYRHAPDKACYSNIRLITSAIEMYNMDVKEKDFLHKFNDETFKLLIENKYLKDKVLCPTQKTSKVYINIGDISNDGVISCGKNPKGTDIIGLLHTDKHNFHGPHGTIEGYAPEIKNNENK